MYIFTFDEQNSKIFNFDNFDQIYVESFDEDGDVCDPTSEDAVSFGVILAAAGEKAGKKSKYEILCKTPNRSLAVLTVEKLQKALFSKYKAVTVSYYEVLDEQQRQYIGDDKVIAVEEYSEFIKKNGGERNNKPNNRL